MFKCEDTKQQQEKTHVNKYTVLFHNLTKLLAEKRTYRIHP